MASIVTPLAQKLKKIIQTDGPISISKFMDLALNDKDYGYYQINEPFGVNGDFITSPEISQVFGELIGLWFLSSWRIAGCPKETKLIELGPGRGTLMADILRTVKKVESSFFKTAELHLVECSLSMRNRQALTLKDYDVTWHKNLDSVPQGPSLIIANEFFDALPIDQYLLTNKGWHEKCITFNKDKNIFEFTTVSVPNFDIAKFPSETFDSEANSVFERNRMSEKYADSIGQRIASNGIAALIIDYGYVNSSFGDTLQAVRGHKYQNPLFDIGRSDITAHVDFANLKKILEGHSIMVHGPVSQRKFLTDLGIEQRTMKLIETASEKQSTLLIKGCKRLIAERGMGSLFKVMSVTQKIVPIPEGFDLTNF